MNNYRFEEIKNKFSDWDILLANSPQCNIYFNSIFLKNIGRPVKCFLVYKTNQIVAGVAFTENKIKRKIELDDIAIYNGIFFASRDDKRLTGTRVEQFEITEFVINELAKSYNKIHLRTHPAFNDIRPFLWHNYENNSKKFLTEVRYTSFLNIKDINTDSDKILTNMSPIRRQHIRYGKEAGLFIRESKNVDLFMSLYAKLMDKTENKISKRVKDRLSSLIQILIDNKLAIIYECLDKSNNIKYTSVFSVFKKKSTYLYGAPGENQKSFDGTFLLWESFKTLNSNYDINEVDLEGVNSPQRGAFKLSFGGNLTNYYILKF